MQQQLGVYNSGSPFLMKTIIKSLVAVATLALFSLGAEAKTLSVLIVDGQNNHNWRAMTPFMKAQLEKTKMFTVDVSTTPQRTRIPGNLSKEKRAAGARAAGDGAAGVADGEGGGFHGGLWVFQNGREAFAFEVRGQR